MPAALDICESPIIRAFQKEGWIIDEKPFSLRMPDRFVLIDFSLKNNLKDNLIPKLIVEVKCFHNPKADLQEFYTAIGQYFYYQSALQLFQISIPLCLAVPAESYKRLLNDPVIVATLNQIELKLVIIDIEIEEIVQWKI